MFYVSIHAPTKGATCLCRVRLVLYSRFQSTHPQRVRHRIQHLPTTSEGFNPRTHKGCDVEAILQIRLKNEFQSTHPQRVRRSFRLVATTLPHVSIHAPTKGATCSTSIQVRESGCFNPRTHKGCD